MDNNTAVIIDTVTALAPASAAAAAGPDGGQSRELLSALYLRLRGHRNRKDAIGLFRAATQSSETITAKEAVILVSDALAMGINVSAADLARLSAAADLLCGAAAAPKSIIDREE